MSPRLFLYLHRGGISRDFPIVLGASDGWIMASDTKENRFAGVSSRRIRETTDTKKLFHDPGTRTTYMISVDDIGRDAAKDILKRVKERGEDYTDMESLQDELPQLASAQGNKNKERATIPTQNHDYLYNSKPFWELWIEPESRIERIYTKVSGGDETNSAKFFIERHPTAITSTKLLPLVAHTILMGAKINPDNRRFIDYLAWKPYLTGTRFYKFRKLSARSERSICANTRATIRIVHHDLTQRYSPPEQSPPPGEMPAPITAPANSFQADRTARITSVRADDALATPQHFPSFHSLSLSRRRRGGEITDRRARKSDERGNISVIEPVKQFNNSQRLPVGQQLNKPP